ncbi:hypothetical protein [Streptomyces sp. NPDC000134]|uniref:hypothetical protein n=1 Tax=Streptomyces sp. NPDC000134 TaxID=3364536 RepID=UPI00368EF517
MTPQDQLRLLPWAGPEGEPCYLSTDNDVGLVSRLADRIEAEQLAMAADLLEEARETLDDDPDTEEDLFLLAAQLAGALRDVLRVATSRGCR